MHCPRFFSLVLCFLATAGVSAQFEALPNIQVNGIGNVPTESNYVPNVVFCENGLASFEALKAQAVAARTYAYYKMNLQGSINDGTIDQVYSCNGGPSAIHFAAAAATEGEILYVEDTVAPGFGDVLIASFYVAGAIPTGPFDAANPGAIPNPGDSDPTGTQQWVTYPYEGGVVGGFNLGTPLGFQGTPGNPNWPNRGAKSQNGADFLSDNSVHYTDILKYYYGADIQLRTAATQGTGVQYTQKVLTDFDDYGQAFGGNIPGHEGYFHRSPGFSGSTSANVAGSTAARSSLFAHEGSHSQRIEIDYDETSGSDFLLRHVSGARLSDFGGSSNAAARVANLQVESIGAIGFWLRTSDPGLQVSIAIDDPNTGDRGNFRNVISDGQWHRYQWFLDEDADWQAWSGVGGNGQVDGDRISIDSIQFVGATDAEVFLDTLFWDSTAVAQFADFNRDNAYTCQDIDLLSRAISTGSNDLLFDVTLDGIVDAADQQAWLAFAAVQNGLPSPYLPGDGNLDGSVDEMDLAIWINNRFSNAAVFCGGDWNHDGAVELRDLHIWNENRMTVSAVPEAGASVWVVWMLAIWSRRQRKPPWRPSIPQG